MSNKWYYLLGGNDDVAVSTRVRLARNLSDTPFTGRLSKDGRQQVLTRCETAASKTVEGSRTVNMGKADANAISAMKEKHLISPEFSAGGESSAVVLSEDESISIMINEEDHLRIQCMLPGLQLKKAYETACGIDDNLSKLLPYAYDEELGFLTHCLTNIGTGMRASVMLHLPALCAVGGIGDTVAAVGKLGLTVRGSYGEGSKAAGCMFQISNQITLGLSEEQIIEKLSAVVLQIIDRERAVRQQLLAGNSTELLDKIWRSYGVLTYSRQLSSAEFMELISDVRLGVSLELIEGLSLETINSLIIAAGAGNIAQQYTTADSPQKRDIARSELLRRALQQNN